MNNHERWEEFMIKLEDALNAAFQIRVNKEMNSEDYWRIRGKIRELENIAISIKYLLNKE